ncbi:hypothetical protein OIDMADRAFT_20143 [Oidiodendron maius Zn]|uniref:Methyltransferase domain-containing protein n=1 Tax=Oidiodendron maius (strain Zn) TaxID=913774 RepID=A0A0C3GRK8_OIDMZ|nr:hypothetical protein OIDMADRAFT_20143 [Oidiodendron maius Zn]
MAKTSTGSEDYVLSRDMHGSVRLDAQHLLWKLHTGYTLNPKIPISSDMKIAEIGTGTGLWLLDLAENLPKTVQLDGYDISDSQYPSQAGLGKNVSLNVLDAFGDVPHHLVGTYDVVHLRFWCCVVKGDNPTRLIRHAMNLLKPGGYIQWEDAHLGRNFINGTIAREFGQVAQAIFKASNIFFNWVGEIDKHARAVGLEVIDYETSTFRSSLVPLCTNTYLMGHLELLPGIAKLNDQQLSVPSEQEFQRLLFALFAETKKGAIYHWPPVTLLAKKPSSSN